jgi:adenosylhomocysteine nucleosidase
MNETTILLKRDMIIEAEYELAQRTYYEGKLYNHEVVLVVSRWSKAAAAITVTTLITKFNTDVILFTNVAGGAANQLNIGDIVIVDKVLHYDLDARPAFKLHEVPQLNITYFHSNERLRDFAVVAAKNFLTKQLKKIVSKKDLDEFQIQNPSIYTGISAGGDQFISDSDKIAQLREDIPDLLCIEMEGAAIAQVCYEHKIPFAIILTISDKADKKAHIDFQEFLVKFAGHYSKEVVRGVVENVANTI